jgi:putative transposase
MSRPLRLEFPGAFYHITSRGDGREAIYLRDADFQGFIDLLGEVCQRCNWYCHAYCLMTNHYHLVIETPDGNLAAGMRHLNGVYTQRFNRQHRRVGHVFQGRYKAIFVDADTYLLELTRYVVLNPVRAGMVKTASQWRWSSYRSMIGKIACPSWLMVERVLSQFGHHRQQAQQRYIHFVAEGQQQSTVWQHLRHQLYLGDQKFVNQMQAYIDNPSVLLEIPNAQRRPMVQSLADCVVGVADTRPAMLKAFATGQFTLKEIADYFGVHYSTVSRVVNKPKVRQRKT